MSTYYIQFKVYMYKKITLYYNKSGIAKILNSDHSKQLIYLSSFGHNHKNAHIFTLDNSNSQ